MSSIIPCLAWVKRGAAKETPDKVTLTKKELKEIIDEAEEKLRESKNRDETVNTNELKKVAQIKKNPEKEDETGLLDEYDLDHYDIDNNEEGDLMTGAGMAGLMYYSSNDDDPYITLKDDDEEKEDYTIKAEDNLIVVGHVDDEYSNLEIYVYNEEEENHYCHHDILLDSFPLALEWLDFDPGGDRTAGNFIAVGSMEPYIDIWDLDLIDTLEPAATLGVRKKSKKKKHVKPASVQGHRNAVLDLSWNHIVRNVLASGSADHSVMLWDLAEAKAVHVLTHHKDKVQSLQWHPYEAQSLLTGSFDKKAKVVDCRSPESSVKSWKFSGEVERVLWNHFSPFHFLASTDNGNVFYCDVRNESPVFTLSAHSDAVSGLALSSQVPGCLVTSSADKTVKVWDILDNKPSFIVSREMDMGRILCVTCCPDTPYMFSLGGEKQGLKLFNIMDSAPVRRHFEGTERLVSASSHSKVLTTNAQPTDTAIHEDAASRDVSEPMEEDSAVVAMAALSVTVSGPSESVRKKKKKKKK